MDDTTELISFLHFGLLSSSGFQRSVLSRGLCLGGNLFHKTKFIDLNNPIAPERLNSSISVCPCSVFLSLKRHGREVLVW